MKSILLVYSLEREWYFLFTGLIEEDEMNNLDYVFQVICVGLAIATFLLNTGRGVKAIEVCKECLILLNNEVLKNKKEQFVEIVRIDIYKTIFRAYCLISDYTNAINYGRQLLNIYDQCGRTDKEKGILSLNLAVIYEGQFKYVEAGEIYNKVINIMREIRHSRGEAVAHLNLGAVFSFLCEYDKAKEHLGKALQIAIEIGDREGEAICHRMLGTVFISLAEFDKAKKHLEKALEIAIKTEDKAGKASCYGSLGTVFIYLGENHKAEEYIKEALKIKVDIGDRKGEATNFGNLGNISLFCGEYEKAKEYLEKALAITIEIGDRAGEASCRGNLGTVFNSLGENKKAEEYIEKALTIRQEIGDRGGKAEVLAKLGNIFKSRGEHDRAKKYLEEALAIDVEIGDKLGEASSYGNLGTVFQAVGDFDRAEKSYKKSLAISSKIGYRKGEATGYINLATIFGIRGEYEDVKENLDKAFEITAKIEDRAGEASCYANLAALFRSLGQYDKAENYFQKGLEIRKAIGDRAGEAAHYLNLGELLFHWIGEHDLGEGYLEKALSISQDIGDLDKEFACLCELAVVMIIKKKFQEAFRYLVLSMKKNESVRAFLRDNDQFKTSFSDIRSFPYRRLAALLVCLRNPNKALYVVELGRARALTDLVATRYSVERQISDDLQSWIGIENIIKQESDCSCLYIFYHERQIFLWIIDKSGVVHYKTITVNESDIAAKSSDSLDDFFAKSLRSFGIVPEEDCEDRSLNDIEPKPVVSQEEERVSLRQGRGEDDPELNLTFFHDIIIAPVVDLLKSSEIIIVPDRHLYHVPFPALHDDSGKYLSETFRIRIVPSLTTLKCIQDSPTACHSQSGVLIVGDPDVGRVLFNGRRKTFTPLPFARGEAEMIGRLLGVQPLIGQQATKQAVLEMLHSAGLMHFAAHGDAERGEIALSPVRSTGKLPKEQDFLLTMSDISKVQLRAKLVVLSCCHSARGQTKVEGVIGMARAILGSGARSVLVALWALNDKATEQFMSRFYGRLVGGDSASESLHEAMKWMRSNGWSEVRQWAPFVLIGDNVSFEFGK